MKTAISNEDYIRLLEREIRETRRKEIARKEFTKKAIIATALTIAVLTAPVASLINDHSNRTEWEATREIITVPVHTGDSIDGYWAEYAPSWMDRADYREDIKELNNMDSCYLYAGQMLKIYVEGGN